MDNPVLILRDALEELRTRGLTKFGFEDKDGRVCAMGALRRAHQGNRGGAIFLLDDVVSEQWPERGGLVEIFNDHPCTTQEDVERAFEKAIARAEELV